MISIVSFSTETCCDRLRANGNSYSGSTSSRAILLGQGETMSWTTDGSVTRAGWEICIDGVFGPSPSLGACSVNGTACTANQISAAATAGGDTSTACSLMCCSGHGTCSTAGGGTCLCDFGFSGDLCENPGCPAEQIAAGATAGSADCDMACCSGHGTCSTAGGGTCLCDLGFGHPAAINAAQHLSWPRVSNRYCDNSGDIGTYSTAAEAASACLSNPSCLYISDGGCDDTGIWETCRDSGSQSSSGSCMYEKTVTAVTQSSAYAPQMCWVNCSDPVPARKWLVGARGLSCDTTCEGAAMECQDGPWGVSDRTSFQMALSSAREDANALCDFYEVGTSMLLAPLIYDSTCIGAGHERSTVCSAQDSSYRRLCLCVGACA